MKRLFIILMVLIGLSYSQDQFPEFPVYPDFLFIPETKETAAYTYQPEALALFARMGDVPEARKQLIDGLIANFKNESLWELGAFWNGMKAIWCFAAHNQTVAPINWIEDDHNCTEVNSPAFEIDRGYTGNGAFDNNCNVGADCIRPFTTPRPPLKGGGEKRRVDYESIKKARGMG